MKILIFLQTSPQSHHKLHTSSLTTASDTHLHPQHTRTTGTIYKNTTTPSRLIQCSKPPPHHPPLPLKHLHISLPQALPQQTPKPPSPRNHRIRTPEISPPPPHDRNNLNKDPLPPLPHPSPGSGPATAATTGTTSPSPAAVSHADTNSVSGRSDTWSIRTRTRPTGIWRRRYRLLSGREDCVPLNSII